MGVFDFLRPAQRSRPKAPGETSRLVVIPVDETKQSLHALEWAIGNVYKQDTDQLHLLSVVPRVAGPYPAEVKGFWDQRLQSYRLTVFRSNTSHRTHATAAVVTAVPAVLVCSWLLEPVPVSALVIPAVVCLPHADSRN
jgi:hypothetical protein